MSTTNPNVHAQERTARAAPSDQALRVMSFNIRHGLAADGDNHWVKRQQVVIKAIENFKPDLLGTQEVRLFQAEFLREQLEGYAFLGVGRDDGKTGGEFSPIFYREQRFELLNSGVFWMSETPDKPGSKSWDSDLPRIAQWAKLRDRRSGKELLFINTHWDHRGHVARVESGKIIRQRMLELAKGAPVVVCGDFNTHEDDESIVAMVSSDHDETKLLDSYRAIHHEEETDEASFHGFLGTTAGRRIDFIFHTPQLRTIDAGIDRSRIDGRYPSDHYPVTAVLEWK